MLLIETIHKIDKRWRLLLMFALVLIFISSAIALFFYIQDIQIQQRTIALEKSVSDLRLQALKAETEGDLNKANGLYTEALAEAEKSGSSMKIIEFLSRLIQVKIQNHKLGQTDALVQKAIKLALSIKDTAAGDSNIEVWMDDMANAFYKRGEHSIREDIKEFCLKHYLDIKLSIEDHYDSSLASKTSMLISQLNHTGRAAETIPYQEKLFDYLKRTKSTDPEIIASPYFTLADKLAKNHELLKAESAFRQGFAIEHKASNSYSDKAAFYFSLARLAEEAGDLQKAIILYQKAIDIERQWLGKSPITGFSENVLAFLEQRLGNFTEAAKLYNASLDCFNHCTPPQVTSTNAFLHPEGGYFSGQVFAAEHLADIEFKREHLALASALRTRAKSIRANNPQWAAAKHPDPDSFYIQGGWLGGYFPFPMEVIPTHLSLQQINQN